jgi:hypothetical protein
LCLLVRPDYDVSMVRSWCPFCARWSILSRFTAVLLQIVWLTT